MIAAIEQILQQEALKGNQHLIDKNKNNKVDPEDFKILRGEKKAVKEEETVDEGIKDVAKKAFKALTGGSDEDQLKNLQKKMGVPQTGKKPEPQKEEVEIVYEANIQPTSAKSRSHISNLSNPTVNSVTHQGKQIGLITKQPSGEYHAHHSAAKLAHAKSETFDTRDKAHQFIRNAHADAIKKGTLSNKFSKTNEDVEQIDELSKSTLGSYVKGAAKDAGASHKLGADFKNQADKSRSPNSKAASSRLSDRFYGLAQKRHTGIGKAVERLTKEEENMPKTLKQFKENAFDWKKKPEPTPNGGSGVKQGSRYGGSKQKDTPEQDTDEKK